MSNINKNDINFFSQKTGISEERAKAILEEVGGLDNFRKEYIALMLERDIEAHKEMVGYVGEMNELARKNKRSLPLIQGFDLSQPNCIISNKVMRCLRFNDSNNNKIFGFFVSEADMENYLKSIKNEDTYFAIMKYFGWNGYKKQTLDAIASESNITRQGVAQRIKYEMKNWQDEVKRQQTEISDEKRQEFINVFFSNNDIFSNGIELTSELKQTLFEIYQEGKKDVNDEREALRKEYEITPENIAAKLEVGKKIYLDDIDFSERARNALEKNGIKTLQDFLDEIIEWEQLDKMPGLGKKTITEIKEKLKNLKVTIYSETAEYQEEMEESKRQRTKNAKNNIKQIQKTGKNISIAELDITTEAINNLRNVGIYTINELIRASKETIEKMPKHKKIVDELHEIDIYFNWENAPLIEGEQITKINQLGLDDRTLRLLVRKGYIYVQQLQDVSDVNQIINIKGMTKQRVEEIIEKMQSYGLSLNWTTLDTTLEITPEIIAKELEAGNPIYLAGIGFSKRVVHPLKKEGIITLQDFINKIKNWEQLNEIPQLGEKTIEDIRNILTNLQVSIYSETIEYQKEEQQEDPPENADKDMVEQYDENIIAAVRISKVSELGLDPKTLKTLEKAGYTDVEQLCGIMDTNEIININGITPDRVKEIIEKMHLKHLYFRHEVEEPISEVDIAFWKFTKRISDLNFGEKKIVEDTLNTINNLVQERDTAFTSGKKFDTSHSEQLKDLLNRYSVTVCFPTKIDDMRAMKLAQFYEKDPSLFDETIIDDAEENSDKKSVDEILQILRIKEKEGNLPKSTRKILMFKIIEKTIPQQEKRTTQSAEEWRAGIEKIIENSSESLIKTLFACAYNINNIDENVLSLMFMISELREARKNLQMEQKWYGQLSAEREELLKGLNELLGDER